MIMYNYKLITNFSLNIISWPHMVPIFKHINAMLLTAAGVAGVVNCMKS